MILTMTKYHKNSLKDSPLSLLSIVKFFSSLETEMILKLPNETFLRITRYIHTHTHTYIIHRVKPKETLKLCLSSA